MKFPTESNGNGPPEWLQEHRELQYLRSVYAATAHPRRSKKKKKVVDSDYVKERERKLKEVKK